MGLPMVQVVMIAARQVSKPIADAVIRYGRDHPVFRNRVLIPVGQALAHMTIRLRMKNLGLGRPAAIAPVSEAAALEQASDFVQQIVIFTYSVGVFAIYYAYTKYTAEESVTKEHLEELKAGYEEKYDELRVEVEKLQKQLAELTVVRMKKLQESEKSSPPASTSKGGKYSKPFPRVSSLPLDDAAQIVGGDGTYFCFQSGTSVAVEPPHVVLTRHEPFQFRSSAEDSRRPCARRSYLETPAKGPKRECNCLRIPC
ncbi:hypothetical protein QR680_005550 [Steinernema hermaphroditum]|uniref:OPA3-like protein n=1 Tax=Steinernema hermaphroditum TaxID=289476 RepID=A0AA39LV28_9BILA|nr:hypothetical protein QR680_005550 [Steinernema hermaphroditum]